MATSTRLSSKVFSGVKARAASRGTRAVTRAKVKNEAPVSEKEFRQNLGYTEKDSAGQANIFAVEPQVYMQGSDENTALVFGVTALGMAAAFGLGYTLVTNKIDQVDEDLTYLLESGQTLSSYQNKFAPPPPPPPAPVVRAVVEAPAPAVEEEAAPAPVAEVGTVVVEEAAL